MQYSRYTQKVVTKNLYELLESVFPTISDHIVNKYTGKPLTVKELFIHSDNYDSDELVIELDPYLDVLRFLEPVDKTELVPQDLVKFRENKHDYGWHTFDLINYLKNKCKPDVKSWYYRRVIDFLTELGKKIDLTMEPQICYTSEHNGGESDGAYNEYLRIRFSYLEYEDDNNSYFLAQCIAAHKIQSAWRNYTLH